MIGDVDPRVLLEAGLGGWVILLAFGASLVLALVGVVLVVLVRSATAEGQLPRPAAARALRGVCWLSAGCGALGIVASVGLSWSSGRTILNAMGSTDFQPTWEAAIERMESTSLTAGLSVFLVSLLAAIGVGVRAIRGRREQERPAWFVGVSCALLFASAAAGVLVRAHLARDPYRGAALAAWEVVWLVEKAAIVAPIAKTVVLSIASLASLGVVVGALRRDTEGSRARCGWTGPFFLALLGSVVWVGSRPLAHDGEHPLPFPHNAFGNYHCPLLRTDPQTLPRMQGGGKRCMDLFSEDIIPLALIDIGPAGATANGRPLKGPTEAFQYVNSHRLLRDAGNPPGHWSVILIAAPASMPAEELGPWLGAVANAQQRFGLVLLHDQPPVVSATAGVVPRGERCSCPRVVLDPKGMSLRGRLWGDVASRAATAQEDAPLALDPGYFWEMRGADVTLVRGTPVDPRRPGQDP